MLHLFHQVREPIDDVERMLIRAFSEVRSVDALWVRETPRITLLDDRPEEAHKRYTRALYVQLGRRSDTDLRAIDRLAREVRIRTRGAPYLVDVRVVVDDLPPGDVAPSCVFRRTSGRV